MLRIKNNIFIFLCILICLLSSQITGEGEDIDEKDVLVLTDENFEQTLKDNKQVLVEFYAPWCGHCKTLKPKYAKAATILKEAGDDIIFAKVDATQEKKSAGLFQVKGYPSLFWVQDGNVNTSKKYSGAREPDDLVSFARKKAGPAVQILTSEDQIQNAEKSSETIAVAYLKELKGSQYDILESVAKQLDDVVVLATNDANLAKAQGLEKEPSIAVITNFKGEDRQVHHFQQKKFVISDLVEFIKVNKLPIVVPFNFNTQVQIFSSDIKKQVLMIGPKSLLQNSMESIVKVAKQLQGKLMFVTVESDSAANVKVVEYFGAKDVKDKIFLIGYGINTASKYLPNEEFSESSLRKFSEDFANDKLKPFYKSEEVPKNEIDSDGLHIVVGKSYERVVLNKDQDVFLELYAPWCGHCKKLAPVLQELQQHFNQSKSLTIAKMDGTKNEIANFVVTGYPTLFFFPANDVKKDQIVKFSGARVLTELIKFVKDNAKKPLIENEATKTPVFSLNDEL